MPQKTWTIVLYINCENDLFTHAISIYNELAVYGSTTEINFLVLTDFFSFTIDDTAADWPHAYLGKQKYWGPSVYYVKKGQPFHEAISVLGLSATTDDLTDDTDLVKLLRKVVLAYPAEHYGFIFKGHGGPSSDVYFGKAKAYVTRVLPQEVLATPVPSIHQTMLYDRIAPQFDSNESQWTRNNIIVLTSQNKVPEIVMASCLKIGADKFEFHKLAKSVQKGFGKPAGFVALDCCWGLSMENLDVFNASICQYFMASSDQSPAAGFGYDYFLQSFYNGRTCQRPEELSKMLVATFYQKRYDDYYNYKDPSDRTFFDYGIAAGMADTRYTEATKTILTALNKHLLLAKDDTHETAVLSLIINARNKCGDFTYMPEATTNYFGMYNIDLIWFLENIAYGAAERVDTSANTAYYSKLERLCYQLIIQIKIYLLQGFISNNYKIANPLLATEQRDSRGITLSFPKTKTAFEDSILSSKSEFYDLGIETSWNELLLWYYNSLEP
jgi:hypothetical protein